MLGEILQDWAGNASSDEIGTRRTRRDINGRNGKTLPVIPYRLNFYLTVARVEVLQLNFRVRRLHAKIASPKEGLIKKGAFSGLITREGFVGP